MQFPAFGMTGRIFIINLCYNKNMESQKTIYIILGIVGVILVGLLGLFAFNFFYANKITEASNNSLSQNNGSSVTSSGKEKGTNTIMTQTANSSSNIPLADKDYKVTLETDAGKITVLVTKATPKTTGNFVKLAKDGFYNGTIFHRVLKGFMIQGGDPRGDGTGGPGYKFEDEKFNAEYTKGIIAMANSGPNTNGSQFFIMHADSALPKNYTIFGKVVEGLDVVDKIATAEVSGNPYSGERSKPVTPVKVNKVTVIEVVE